MKRSAVILAILTLQACVSLAYAADEVCGSAVPWITYEAELAKTNGVIFLPECRSQTPAREASGRACVRLSKAGDYLEFIATADAQGVVVRYSHPDLVADSPLTLSINDQPSAKLTLTSRFSHVYGSYPFGNDPAAQSPRNFWDEVRVGPTTMRGAIHTGDRVRIEKGDDSVAGDDFIDFVDLELVAPPLEKPANALPITDFGATPDFATDARPALMAAIAAAKAQQKMVWIPQGHFTIAGPIEVSDVTIQGAGIWYTTLVGADDYSADRRVSFVGSGSNITLADFSIVGKLNYRNDSEANDGLGGSFGTGSVIRNLWVEHTKTGAWLTNSDGLIVEGCRFRNTMADGINLCVGMHGTTVRNCTARGTGDDCFAIWPATYANAAYTSGSNRFVHCTAQVPFLAQGFSIYGGDGNSVVDCEAIDIPYGAGLFASTTFPTESGFSGTTMFQRDKVIRAGDREGAIGTVANRIDLTGLRFEHIDVIDSPNDAIRFMSVQGKALRDTAFDHVHIQTTGINGAGYGVASADDAVGSVTLSHLDIEGAKSGAFRNVSSTFEFVQGDGAATSQEESRHTK